MAWRQDHAGRTFAALGGGERFQRPAQQFGILVHRLDAVGAKQLREHPHHDLAVLQHVTDARGRAAIVLEHVEFVLGRADDVDADDMGIDTARGHDADHGLFVSLVPIDQPRRDTPRPHNLAPAVNVTQKGVQRPGALLDTAFQAAPFGLLENAGHHVEGDQPVRVAPLAIDGKGDADAAEQRLGLGLLHLAEIVGHRLDPFAKPGIGLAHRVAVEHLVVVIHGSPVLRVVSGRFFLSWTPAA